MAAGQASGAVASATAEAGAENGSSYTLPMVLMVSLYFGIGFITALNDILVPHFKDLFHLSNFLALLVQFCFFGAYFVMSLPSGWIVGRIGYKLGIIAALSTMGMGLLLFVPASIVISYPLFLFALFVVGSGLALLQVAINPYVGALGKPQTAAARLNLCGFFNSLATTVAPGVGAAFIFIAAGATAAQLARSVRVPYVLIACFTFSLAVITLFVPLPELIERRVEVSAQAKKAARSAWQFVHLRLGALAIFTYVGAEVAIGSLMINFLGQPSMGSMSHAAAAHYVQLYWGGAMVGRLIGSAALLKVPTERALATVASVAALLVAIAIFGHGSIAMWAVVSCGLFNSVMWPCIFPLSVKGLGKFTSEGSGILVMMVVGGAVIPEIQGLLADRFGYQHSFAIVLLCYTYLIYFALSGYRMRQPKLATEADFLPPVEV
jgi:FHS family L-fucose permease-like MFS transporter